MSSKFHDFVAVAGFTFSMIASMSFFQCTVCNRTLNPCIPYISFRHLASMTKMRLSFSKSICQFSVSEIKPWPKNKPAPRRARDDWWVDPIIIRP
jgi:hypothetical protein